VHGCFWHQHEVCGKAMIPSVRRSYWRPKLERNKARDKAAIAALRKRGWKVAIVWECECRDIPKLTRRLRRFTQPPRRKATP
jgi:DNA mismatch endonuclease (patch repair protein)